MIKIFRLLSVLLIMPLISCEEEVNFDKKEISGIIQEIENSINQDDLMVFQKNSSVLTFFNFNSILCGIASKKSNERVFVIKPFSFEADDDYIEVGVFLNYLIDFNIKSAQLKVPPKVMQKIVSFGLPNKAYFHFSVMDNQYFLTEIDYPFRYKYMELLENFL